MANPRRQPFYPHGEFVARKDFTFDGTKFGTGDNFPWEKLGVPERKMRQMFDGRFLMRKDDTKKTVTIKATPKPDVIVEKKEKPAKKIKSSDDDKKEARRKRAAARREKAAKMTMKKKG